MNSEEKDILTAFDTAKFFSYFKSKVHSYPENTEKL